MNFATFKSYWQYRKQDFSITAFVARHKRWRLIGGVLLILAFLTYFFSGTPEESTVEDHIARITVDLSPNAQRGWLTQLNYAMQDDKAKGILLFIDQSIMDGSDFAQTESALHAIYRVRHAKPVASFIYGYAHGNSYVIASSTDYILAQETASIGGISVISSRFDLSELMDKFGVKVINKGFGDYKVEPKKDDPNYNKFIQHRKSIYQQMHHWMLMQINENRKLTPAQTDSIRDGQWYTGTRAKSLALCDAVGDITDAEDWIRRHAAGGSNLSLPSIDYSSPSAEAELGLAKESWFSGLQSFLKKHIQSFFMTQLSTALRQWQSDAIHHTKIL